MNERVNDWSFKSLNALIVTDWDDMDSEGVPDMVPVDSLSMSPVGRDPDITENEGLVPCIVGEAV